jgi:hypothetical protein
VRQTVLLGQAHELVHAVWGFVGEADVAHLAGLHQPRQRFELFVDRGGGGLLGGVVVQRAKSRHVTLGPVDLVEVDHIGLQPAQAAFARGNDVRGGHALVLAHPGHAAGRPRHLGGQHQLFAGAWILLEPVADDGFGRAAGLGLGRHRVHLRGVDEIHAALQRAAEDGMRIGFVDLFTEGHGAKADGGDVQVAGAELDCLHRGKKDYKQGRDCAE